MAPEATAGSVLNYIFLLVGMSLIGVMLQSLVRFEAIRVQMVWAVSVHIVDHAEDHVSRVANETFDAGESTVREFKRNMSMHADEGGLGLSVRQSKALQHHLDLKRSGSISRAAFEEFYDKAKRAQGRGIDVDEIMRRQATRRGMLSMTIAGMLTYVLLCGAVLMALEKGTELQAAEQFLDARSDFCEKFFEVQDYDFGNSSIESVVASNNGSIGEVSCARKDTNSVCTSNASDPTERHCYQFCCEKGFPFCFEDCQKWCISNSRSVLQSGCRKLAEGIVRAGCNGSTSALPTLLPLESVCERLHCASSGCNDSWCSPQNISAHIENISAHITAAIDCNFTFQSKGPGGGGGGEAGRRGRGGGGGGGGGPPGPAPTAAPTAPTDAPTHSPTAPTDAPTAPPTSVGGTSAPASAPTSAPTSVPTQSVNSTSSTDEGKGKGKRGGKGKGGLISAECEDYAEDTTERQECIGNAKETLEIGEARAQQMSTNFGEQCKGYAKDSAERKECVGNAKEKFKRGAEALDDMINDMMSGLFTCSKPDPDNLNWEFLSASAWAMTVFTTVGYGNFAVSTEGGKAFVCISAIGGFVVFGYASAVLAAHWVSDFTSATTIFHISQV
jgi:hypothetical protein